ncbi:MAG: alkaline phosphatase family protein [Bdellovibrionales bacterium]|nr:alkaline phosphatase family protein [Bdellovibrionales bacterium]
MTKRSVAIFSLVSVLLLLFFWRGGGRRSPLLPEVKLVVFVVVDQFADEYLDRFDSVFTGGIRLLVDEGVVLRKVLHPHEVTATCPGHASIVTGAQPSTHGIVNNWWYDRKAKEVRYCVDDGAYSRSPDLLQVNALPDWIKDRYPRSRSYAVSGKDRSAIMMAGKEGDAALWYDKSSGMMASSRYYFRRGYPWWLSEFNKEGGAKKYFGRLWTPLVESAELFKKTGTFTFDFGDFPETFPYALGGPEPAPGPSFFADVYNSPFVDELTFNFAERLLTEFQLGNGEGIDYLALSLSALDTVGHGAGANSPKVFDVLMRIDRGLESFIALLEEKVGLDRTLIVFTSDHGIPPFPEALQHYGMSAHFGEESKTAARVSASDISCLQRAHFFGKESGQQELFEAPLYVKEEFRARDGLVTKKISDKLKGALGECAPVSAVYDSRDIEEYRFKGTRDSSSLATAKRNFFRGRSPDFSVLTKPYYSLTPGRGINHGTPYRYDAEVPVIFFGANVSRNTTLNSERRLWVTDIAGTVARLLGVSASPEAKKGLMMVSDE